MAVGQKFAELLVKQIGNEFGASQQYVANAVFFERQTLPRLAAFFYAQAVEERNHALMMVQYLVDSNLPAPIPGVTEPRSEFGDIVEPIRISLEQEKRVTDQISALAAAAREENDFQSEQFIQWFLKEQVEEVATMSDLLAVVERSADSPQFVEEFLVREHPGEHEADPTAPPAAGGAL